MTPAESLRAIAYPVTNGVVFVGIIVFGLLLSLVAAAGLLGIWLMIAVLPALVRFQVMVLEARMRGVDPQPPGIEFFSIVGNAWTLFPLVHLVLFAVGVWKLGELFGAGGIVVFSIAMALVYPASLIVLALTHSPLQSLNPVAIGNLMDRVGFGYIVLPLYFVASAVLSALVFSGLPALLRIFADLVMGFSFMSLSGSLMAPFELEKEIDIPDPLEKTPDAIAADLENERTGVLTHAYGFVSRDNRTGGLGHIYGWLERDPDPAAAWAWFFERMMQWERNEAALFFAQQHLKRLLAAGQGVAAVKVMMRCRLVNERFKPLEEDRAAAIAAARACNNEELAAVLERG